MGLDYLVNLRDGLSSPSRKMAGALLGLSLGLAQVQARAKQLGRDLALAGSIGVDLLRQKMEGATSVTKYLQLGLLGVAAGAGAAAAALGIAIVKTASFRESSITRLSALLGGQERGNREFIDAVKIAERTPYSVEQVVNTIATLGTVFKNDDQRREIFGALSDFTTVVGGGNVEVMKGVTKALTDMAGKGKVEMEELKGQLADHGLALSQTLPQIAALMGITGKTQEQVMDKVRKAIKAGQVSGDVGVFAVYKAMKAAAGGRAAGAATEAGSGTIAGLLSNIKEGLTTVIALQDTENWAGIRALKDLLGSIANLFRSDSAEGQRLAGSLRGLTDAAAPFFALVGYEFNRLKDGLVGSSVEAENFRRGLEGIAYGATGVMGVLYGLYRVVAFAAGGIVQLFGGAVALGEWLGDLTFEAVQWGSDVVDGLIKGLKAGLGRLKDAVAGLGTETIATLKGVLGIASPSREMAAIGVFSALGYLQGLEQPDVRGAAAAVAEEAAAGMAGAGAAAAGVAAGQRAGAALAAAGAGGGITIQVGDVNVVSGAADVAGVAADVRRTLGADIVDQVEAALQRRRAG